MELQIIERYKSSNISLEDLSKEFKIGKLKLKKILTDNNVTIRKKGGQVKHHNKDNVVNVEPHMLECKNCKKTFNDYENKSGSITNHIKECYPDVIIPSSFKRRMFLKENGYHFHLDFFIKKEIEEVQKLKCPLCEWETNDLTNKSGSFTKHIEKTHGSISEFLNSNPNLNLYFSKIKIMSDEFDIPNRNESEIELLEYISGLGVKVMTKNKNILNGVELDIFLPDYNIGIEFNELHCHSEKIGKTKTYHIDKTNKCLSNNIRLIHIFSDEWDKKKEIIKDRVKTLLGLVETPIYGRKCEIVTLTNDEKKKFLNSNHLQGNDKSTIFYGLNYNCELVSVMTFGKLRNVLGHRSSNNDDVYEIYRFCGKNVIGGFTKLLKHFIRNHNPVKIITYADRNWSPSDEFCFYGKMGFNFVGSTKPNYSYTKNYSVRHHRYNFRKDKLVSLGYDKTKTENEIMVELGYDKIWDTGNLKYEMNIHPQS